MSTEKEFGFIITQGITRKMTKAKRANKITGFLSDRKKALMKTLKLPENRIHTSCYYDRDSREYKGMIRIKKECSDSRIEQIQKQNKSIWAAKDCCGTQLGVPQEPVLRERRFLASHDEHGRG